MSDLISRSELLKKFNDSGIQITFDLPVEEILGEDVAIDDFTMLVQDAIQAYKKMVIGTIKDIPTAYDVEGVLEELEASSVNTTIIIGSHKINRKVINADRAISIVQAKKYDT